MKTRHITRKKAFITAGIAAVSLAVSIIIPKVVKAVKHRRYSASF